MSFDHLDSLLDALPRMFCKT